MHDLRRIFEVVANYAATMTVVLLGLWIVTRGNSFLAEYNVNVTFHFFGAERIVNTSDVLIWLCAFYAVVLIPYYALRPGFRLRRPQGFCLRLRLAGNKDPAEIQL